MNSENKKMRYLKCLLALALSYQVSTTIAQNVVVSGAHSSSNGSYATLGAAFTAINGQVQTGNNIQVSVDANTTETASAVLNAGAWTSLRIFPSVAGLTIGGNLAAPLIDLNGAANVTVDGRSGGNSSGSAYALTIRNTNTSATAGTSTIRFINGASADTVHFTRIEGSGTLATSGTVFFSTSTAVAGNNNNVIKSNLITHASGNRSVNALYSLGTSTKENTSNVVRDNEFIDFLSSTMASQAILLESHTTNWSIIGNSFYQTSPLAPSNTWGYGCIHINNTSHQGAVIWGNYIGGTQALAGGTPWTKTNISRNTFYGIRLNVGTASPAQIDSNIIQNITWSNNSGADWVGIDLMGGNADIGAVAGNRVGGSSAAIQISSSTTNFFNVYGISIGGAGTINLRNNSIENISMSSAVTGSRLVGILVSTTGTVLVKDNIIRALSTTSTNTTLAVHLYGIHKTGSGTFTAEDNIIGNPAVANSLWAQSPSTSNAQEVIGIVNLNTGNLTISGNTISNLTNASNSTTTSINGYTQGITSVSGVNLIENNTIQYLTNANANNNAANLASVGGIVVTGTSLKTVRANVISNLQNTFTNFAGHIYGVYFSGSNGTDNGVYRNFIHSLSAPNNTATAAANLHGIRNASVSGVTANITNNIIVLQGSQTTTLYGIFDNANTGAANIYHNTVYIGGTAGSGAASSYALWSDGTSTRDYRNNILVNERTGGGGSHYAIRIAGTTGLTINHNLYRVSVNGITGLFTSNRTTLANWQTATGQDAMSLNVDPQFALAGGTSSGNYVPSANNLVGMSGLPVNDDFLANPRVYRNMGAFDVITLNPVEVISSVGVAQATYDNLTTAFARINDGTHQGDIRTIIHVSHPLVQSAVLNASGTGSANYSGVRVYPSSNTLVVSGNLSAPLIDLNGASNVAIDGRVGGKPLGTSYALTLRNTNTSATAGTSTIRWLNGASSDTVQFCRIEGSSTSATTGTLFFSISSAPAGNNNNLIFQNLITNAGGSRPVNSIYSSGTASPSMNTANILRENELFDFFSPSIASQGVLLDANNANWRIEGNSFYQTTSFAPTAAVGYSTIWLNSTGVNGTVIRGNFIGGSAAQAGGTAFTKTNSNSNPFYGIRINAGTTTATQIDSNIIRHISWTNSTGNNWFGIDVAAGLVDIGVQQGNILGASGAGISVTTSAAAAAWNLYGINLAGSGNMRLMNNRLEHITLTSNITGSNLWAINTASTGTLDIDNNVIANLTTATTTGTMAANLYGIYKTASSGTLNIRNNTIGSTITANSLHASSTSTSNTQLVYGIQNLGSGTVTMSGNTIANLTNATTHATTSTTGIVNGINSSSGTNLIENNTIRDLSIANANTSLTETASVGGIVLTGATVKTVQGNTIFNLRNTRSDFAGHIHGIYFTGATGTNNGIFRNFIHSLEAPTNSGATAANIYGIRQVPSGVATIANNIVVLQGAQTAILHGLYDNGTTGTTNFYHNTVYLGGTAGAGSAASYALWSNAATATQDYRNNILVNERTGGTGTHYAIRLAANTTLTINHNLYRVGAGGVVGFLTSNRNTLSNWQTATLQDQNSISIDPLFTSAGGTNASDYFPLSRNPNLRGALLANVSDDFQGNNRTYYSRGAYEYQLAIWWIGGNGAQPQSWNNSNNWSPAQIPGLSDIVWMEPNNNGYNLVLDQNRAIKLLTFNQSNKKVILGNYKLSITDSIAGADSLNYILTNGTGCLNKPQAAGVSRLYPVGRTSYNPVRITNKTVSTDSFCVCVYDEVRSAGLTGTVLSHDPRIRRTWDIQKGSGSADSGNGVDFTFWWNAGEDTLNPTTFYLSHYNGSSWIQQPGSSTIQGRSLSYNGYMGSFSPFAINGNHPLPVSWMYVKGRCAEELRRLEWATATEINNRRFVVEGSSDGNTWEALKSVEGAGNSASIQTYSAEIHTTHSYLRLRQEDFDGSSNYSEAVFLACGGVQPSPVVLPNPSEGVFRVLGGAGLKSYVLLNALGMQVKAGLLYGLDEWSLDLCQFEKGMYSLRLKGEEGEILRKLLIK
jgi:hypothetical protein